MPIKERLHRSELAVPGSNPRMLEKAPTLGADIVFMDLEDAVAPADKEQARKNVIHALQHHDWSRCAVSVRINALDTHFCYRDIVDLVEQAGKHLDTLLVPKVNAPEDIYYVATMLSQIEAAKGLKPIGIHALIETARGMANIEDIAASCPERMEALVFGVADFAASTQARVTHMGGANADYAVLTHPEGGKRERHWNDQWHYAQARLVVACRAYGLRPIDGPFSDIQDPDGFRSAARSAAALGIEGKWAIHPSQIALANEVFSPTEAEVTRAERIIAAMAEASKKGLGAVTLDGRMLDAASIRQAEVVMEKMLRIKMGQEQPA
ncbi:MAG: CoA ester lyase [Gammaproteobacteria bacterium]|nr:CoA ester lyase [Gammaproteobacteria bacterium]MDH5512175.1 CoA ester lyase [Gammaproteobacteria bacterium]